MARRRVLPEQRPILSLVLGMLLLSFVFGVATPGAAAKISGRPRVYADASLIDQLVAAPVPNYPTDAVKKNWSGLGVFELRFRPDGRVWSVVTVLTTGHKLLDDTARASLSQWRCKPLAHGSARMTMSFSIHHDPVTINPIEGEQLKNIPFHPLPTYPYEARRHRWVGRGLFVMRFRPDGSVEKAVALKSTDHALLDQETLQTLLRWRCLPGVHTSAFIPIVYTISQ